MLGGTSCCAPRPLVVGLPHSYSFAAGDLPTHATITTSTEESTSPLVAVRSSKRKRTTMSQRHSSAVDHVHARVANSCTIVQCSPEELNTPEACVSIPQHRDAVGCTMQDVRRCSTAVIRVYAQCCCGRRCECSPSSRRWRVGRWPPRTRRAMTRTRTTPTCPALRAISTRSRSTLSSWNSQPHCTQRSRSQPQRCGRPQRLPHSLTASSTCCCPPCSSPHLRSSRVAQQSPAGVYVLPSSASLYVWHGLIFVRKGFYRKAILPFTLTIPSTYPAQPPTVTFPTHPFHPLITSGTLSLSPSLTPWSPQTHLLLHVIAHVKKAFYRTEWWAEPSAGSNAAKELWRNDKGEFGRRVERAVRESVEGVWEAGKEMRVTRGREVHERVWTRVQERWKAEEEGRPVGPFLDWFMPGVTGLVDEDSADPAKVRIAVTADEEREWVEEELQRRAEERKQRIASAVAAQELTSSPPSDGETTDDDAIDVEAPSTSSQYALDTSGDGDEVLP